MKILQNLYFNKEFWILDQNENAQLQNFSSQLQMKEIFWRNKSCKLWEKAWFPPRRFLQYNLSLIGVSYGHDFFINAKN